MKINVLLSFVLLTVLAAPALAVQGPVPPDTLILPPPPQKAKEPKDYCTALATLDNVNFDPSRQEVPVSRAEILSQCRITLVLYDGQQHVLFNPAKTDLETCLAQLDICEKRAKGEPTAF